MKYSIVFHFDVWGNKKDGFEVNDSRRLTEVIELSDSADDSEVLRALKVVGLIVKHARVNMFEFENLGESVGINQKDGRPLFTLEPVEELKNEPDPTEPVAAVEGHMLDKDDCIPGSSASEYENQVLILRAERLKPEYRQPKFQLYRAYGGFGCSPDKLGRAVFAKCLEDGEENRWNREDFHGIARPEIVAAFEQYKAEPVDEGACYVQPSLNYAQMRKALPYFFEPGAMRFFNSRLESDSPTAFNMFVTSEQCSEDYPRLYTIRYFNAAKSKMWTVGPFQHFKSKYEAETFLRNITTALKDMGNRERWVLANMTGDAEINETAHTFVTFTGYDDSSKEEKQFELVIDQNRSRICG
jgi:hypothetical protein